MNAGACFAGGGGRAALPWLAAVLVVGKTVAFGGMAAVRDIEEGFLAGGRNAYETEVTVTVEGVVPSSMILQEVLPEGWTVERATWNGADLMPRQVSGGTNKWLFGLGVEPGDGVLRYVTRTGQVLERSYAVSGSLAYLNGGKQVVVESAGDTIVRAMDSDGDGLPDDWESKFYGGKTDCDAGVDTDGDGMSAWDEFVAGSNPTDGRSFLYVELSFTNGEPVVSWRPDMGKKRNYAIEGTANLRASEEWSTQTNSASRFFRVKVELLE